jgi:hypothetical protein
MAGETEITLYEMSAAVRHWEVAYGTAGTARLYVETFTDARGKEGCTCRLHFDSAVDDATLRTVVDAVKRAVLDQLPRGLCMVYVGSLRATLDIGAERTLQ